MRRSSLGLFAIVLLLPCKSTEGSGGDLGNGDDTGTVPIDSGNPCGAGKIPCGGTCIDAQNDPANCGACGLGCGTAQCCTGKCVDTSTCAYSVTGVGFIGGAGWQNGGDYITVQGNGFAAGMKLYLGDGRAPVWVKDAHTGVAQTPPGPVGFVDVKIDLAGKTAVLKQGFKYSSADLSSPWQQKPMQKVRGEDPGIAVMQDGRVLVAGGTTVPDSAVDAVNTAEIYTRTTDKVDPAANVMSVARWHDSAITLLDGRVLVVGAASGLDGTLADLFDPKTNTFTPTKGKLAVSRTYTRSVLLVDGRVLVTSAGDPNAEVFDPQTETFTTISHATTHQFGFIVRLRDGRVLFGAGDGGDTTVEIFDPDTSTFSPTAPLAQGRSMLTAHVVPDGRALVIGGASLSAGGIHVPLDSIEAFDPKTNTWSTMPYKMTIGRTWLASALVRDGTILAMGGYTLDAKCDSLTDSVDQIDPVKGTVTPFAKLPNANCEWNATTMLDGSVLGVGGGACGTASALPDLDFLPGKPGPS